jgi:hypothetical protein
MKIIKLFIALISFVVCAQLVYGQKLSSSDVAVMKQYEDSLIVKIDSIRNSYLSDEKLDISFRFISILKSALNHPGSFHYEFDSLKKIMHILESPDGNFKIFNWVVSTSPIKKNYFGAIQTSDQKIIPLIDYSEQLEEQNTLYNVVNNKQWFGGEYYKIMKDVVDGETVYLLFGFNSNSSKFNRKFIDALRINNGQVTFGAPIFKAPDNLGSVQLRNRFIQFYKKGVTITLNWDASINAIVFNKLESDIGAPTRLDSYVPSGQIDALKKQGNIWQYHPNALSVLKLTDGNAPIDGVMN